VQRSRVNINGSIYIAVSLPSQRCTFDELESLAILSRRVRHRWHIVQPPCACGAKPLRGPPAALPRAGMSRHARAMTRTSCACGSKPRRGPPVALQGACVCRHARGNGADYHCAPRRRTLFEDWSAFSRLSKPPLNDQRSLMAIKKARRQTVTQPRRQNTDIFVQPRRKLC
jgi:hypothetical protein